VARVSWLFLFFSSLPTYSIMCSLQVQSRPMRLQLPLTYEILAPDDVTSDDFLLRLL
jgi:hypothetical protein